MCVASRPTQNPIDRPRFCCQPHSVHALGTANVTIGPHTFAGTSFHEIRWSTEAPESTSTPPSEGLPQLSQSLYNRLHSEAAKDKLLMGILQRVTLKQATPQESSALNRYIIALRASMLSTPRSSSLVLEFTDNLGERFLLPSPLLAVPAQDGFDLNFHLVPLSSQNSTPAAVLVTMQLSEIPQELSSILTRLSAKNLASIPDQPRVYLELQTIDKTAVAATQKKIAPSTTLNVSSTGKATKPTKGSAKAVKKKSLPGDKTPVDGKRAKVKAKKGSSTAKGKGKEKVRSNDILDVGKEVKDEMEVDGEVFMDNIKARPTKRQSQMNTITS